MPEQNWAELHQIYQQTDWKSKPSLFAEFVKDYLPSQGRLLDLGAGLGQDSRYFASLGLDVVATDLEVESLLSDERNPESGFAMQKVDLREVLPFEDASFDVVYAHLSLHYFDEETTQRIFAEIKRVLRPGALFAYFVNTVTDPEYGAGTQLGDNYFDIEGVAKRYFTVGEAKRFAADFEVIVADDQGETYKDSAKGIHNLIRFVGRKI